MMIYDVDVPFSNLFVAQKLHKLIPQNSIVNYAILNSLRCWNYFPLDKSIKGYSNVAAFGIDGCNSMLFGESMASDELCLIVTGDLAFFYDMNSLGIRHIKNNVRILLINNGGGAEFKIMTRNWKNDIDVEDFIAANGHNGSAEGWANNCGFKYISAKNKGEFSSLCDVFISNSNKPILFEVFTEEQDEVMAMNLLLQANNVTPQSNDIKQKVKSIIGEKGITLIKSVLGDKL